MDNKERASFYLALNGKLFPTVNLPHVRQILEGLDEDKFLQVTSQNYRDPMMMLLFSFALGLFGVDRFLVGDILIGILKLITFGGWLIWWFIDLFFIGNRAKQTNYNKLVQAALIAKL